MRFSPTAEVTRIRLCVLPKILLASASTISFHQYTFRRRRLCRTSLSFAFLLLNDRSSDSPQLMFHYQQPCRMDPTQNLRQHVAKWQRSWYLHCRRSRCKPLQPGDLQQLMPLSRQFNNAASLPAASLAKLFLAIRCTRRENRCLRHHRRCTLMFPVSSPKVALLYTMSPPNKCIASHGPYAHTKKQLRRHCRHHNHEHGVLVVFMIAMKKLLKFS